MAPDAPHGPNRSNVLPTKRSSMACTTCRQVKLRCDAQKRFPAPCSRCEARHRVCVFDAGFKRRVVRGALEKVIEEKEQLRRRLLARASATPESTPQTQADSSINVHSPLPDPTPDPVVQEPGGPPGGPFGSEESTSDALYDLHGVYIGADTVAELFEQSHFLRHLPILDVRKSPAMVHCSSSLLFWAVVLTAARRHPTHGTRAASLQTAFKKLLSDNLVYSIRSEHTIQALLLLCVWPFALRYQVNDPSWNYCCLAASAAMQMGLQDSRPNAAISPEKLALRLKTWLGCFVISTRLAADHSLPPPMSSTAKVAHLVEQRIQDDVPSEFWSLCALQRCAIRAAAVLNSASGDQPQSSLLNVLENDLEDAVLSLPQPLSLPVHIDFLASKLRLHTIPLLSRTALCSDDDARVMARATWYKGFQAAVQLISLFMGSQGSAASHAGASEPQIQCSEDPETVNNTYPKHYFRILVVTGMFLTKLLAVDHNISAQDRILARNHIKSVYEVLRAISTEEMDEFDRAAHFIGLLSQHAEDSASSAFFQEPASGPSPTIVDDSVRIAQKIRRKEPGEAPSEPSYVPQGSLPEAGPAPATVSSFDPQDLVMGWDNWFFSAEADYLDFWGSQTGSFATNEPWTSGG